MPLQDACIKDASSFRREAQHTELVSLLLYGVLGLDDKLCVYIQDNNQQHG